MFIIWYMLTQVKPSGSMLKCGTSGLPKLMSNSKENITSDSSDAWHENKVLAWQRQCTHMAKGHVVNHVIWYVAIEWPVWGGHQSEGCNAIPISGSNDVYKSGNLSTFSALNLSCSCTQQYSECSPPSERRDWKTCDKFVRPKPFMAIHGCTNKWHLQDIPMIPTNKRGNIMSPLREEEGTSCHFYRK
jgi:hypothetical protein